MKFKQVFIVVIMLACVACASPNSGKYPGPVYLPQITEVIAPTAPVAEGSTVTLAVEWIQGREPFEVTWFFGDDEEGEMFPVATRSHTYEYVAVNETGAELTVLGVVEVKDAGGNPDIAQFSFTIAPAV